MADSEEDFDSWRNRDKYPKEREVSEKKASLSPADQKMEKRPFHNYQSPSKSAEPPFKKQKNNIEDDFVNKAGSIYNNRRDGYENRRDNFDSRKDNLDNRKGNFDVRKNNFDIRKDNFDNRNNFVNRNNNFDSRKDNVENRKDIFDNRRDNFDNRRDFSDIKKDVFDSKRENFDTNFSITPMVRTTEESPNYPTQPPMLLFKHFLLQQDDNIEMEVAMSRYNEYKDAFVKKQLKSFFDAHCIQEWFREKYLPSFVEINKSNEMKNISLRKEIFTFLYERQWMDNIKLHVDESDSIVRLMDAIVILLEGGNANDLKILDTRRYRSESPNDIRIINKKIDNTVLADENIVKSKLDSELHVKGVKLMEKDSTTKCSNTTEKNNDLEETVQEPRALHKTFSIFLRNLHPNVLRSEIESLVRPYTGFLRLALQDPTPDRKFFRRGWVTYDRTVNIKEICWNLNNIRLHDCDIGAIVNRELSQRVRSVNVLTNHKPVMRQDLKLTAKLVAKFDKHHNLWQAEEGVICSNPMSSSNPLLRDITEYLVDEGSYEEEALLGGNLNCNLELTSTGSDPMNIKIDIDDKLVSVLDKLVLYLRFVHSYDYYSNTEYQSEDDMPHRCGIIHARASQTHSDRPLSLKDVEEYIKTIEVKADLVLNTVDKLKVEEANKLGFKSIEEVTETFILANTLELAKDKWLCPLSGKKFKGPDFVRKHILNKHMDQVDEVIQMAHFFNNYLMDVKRPQLPEHPTNRSGVKIDDGGDNHKVIRLDADVRGGNIRLNESDRRGNYRGQSPANRDFGGRNNYNFDNRGSYYMKDSFSGRVDQSRQRNGGGSYYSRNIMSYKDLDAPMDD